MKAWRKHRNDREHWPEHWRVAVAMRRSTDRIIAFILTKGKHMRFELKREVQLKRAMQLMEKARDKKGGNHDDKVYECPVIGFSEVYEFDVGDLRDAQPQRKIPGGD